MNVVSVVSWSPAYACGITAVDDQHKQLIELARLLHIAVRRKAPEAAIEQAMTALTHYAHTHFQTEEAALAQCCDEFLDAHKAEHLSLSREIELLAIDRLLAFECAFAERLAEWVNKRLVRHMIETDGASFRRVLGRSSPGEESSREESAAFKAQAAP